jgi:hypothetical protein
MSGKEGHTLEFYVVYFNTETIFYDYTRNTCRFWVFLMLQSAASGKTLTRVGLGHLILPTAMKGVNRWTFLFVCVFLGHRNIEKLNLGPNSHKITPVEPEVGYSCFKSSIFLSGITCPVKGVTLGSWTMHISTLKQHYMFILGTHSNRHCLCMYDYADNKHMIPKLMTK